MTSSTSGVPLISDIVSLYAQLEKARDDFDQATRDSSATTDPKAGQLFREKASKAKSDEERLVQTLGERVDQYWRGGGNIHVLARELYKTEEEQLEYLERISAIIRKAHGR